MVAPYKILIIEDDPEHAELIKLGFRRHDEFFLDFAATGEEALQLITEISYDLISVDLVLPGMSGLDVLVRIRKHDPDIPVVMVSGHGTTEMAVIAFENRATKYVVKSLESFKSLPYVFENLIQESRFKSNEREMRKRIERSERIHRNIVENALAGIYILQDGVFKLVNPKLCEIFGCPSESLTDMPFWQMVKPDDMAYISKLDREQNVPSPVYESRIQRKDGTTRWIEFRTVPIEYEGRRAVLGNLLDITPRKERELQILRENRELSAMQGIREAGLKAETDIEGALMAALPHIIAGLSGALVGGIFLQQKGSLVLKALEGSVEELISFVHKLESGILLITPRVFEAMEGSQESWISAPIHCNGKAEGAIVVAMDGSSANDALSFLERSASWIGSFLEHGRLHESLQQTEEMPKFQIGTAEESESAKREIFF